AVAPVGVGVAVAADGVTLGGGGVAVEQVDQPPQPSSSGGVGHLPGRVIVGGGAEPSSGRDRGRAGVGGVLQDRERLGSCFAEEPAAAAVEPGLEGEELVHLAVLCVVVGV